MHPFDGMRARIDRRTAQRRVIGADEALSPMQALALYTWDFALSRHRSVAVGEVADLCLLQGGSKHNLADNHAQRVSATVVGRHNIYQ